MVKYLDINGTQKLWTKVKEYIDNTKADSSETPVPTFYLYQDKGYKELMDWFSDNIATYPANDYAVANNLTPIVHLDHQDIIANIHGNIDIYQFGPKSEIGLEDWPDYTIVGFYYCPRTKKNYKIYISYDGVTVSEV